MTSLQAVIFDMDGLMFDTETIYYHSNQKAADALGLDFDYSVYEEFIGASDADFFEGMHKRWNDPLVVNRFIESSQATLKEAMRNDTIGVKKGLPELLRYLESEGVQRIVASSSERKLVELLLERTGIRPYIQDIVAGDEVEKAKPHPEIFLKAWGKTGSPKENVWILEDSLNGIRAAHSAGIRCLMVPDLIPPNKEAKEKAYAVHEDLTDVLSFFKGFNK